MGVVGGDFRKGVVQLDGLDRRDCVELSSVSSCPARLALSKRSVLERKKKKYTSPMGVVGGEFRKGVVQLDSLDRRICVELSNVSNCPARLALSKPSDF